MRNSFFLCLLTFFLTASLAINTTDDLALNDSDNHEMSFSAQEIVLNEEAITENTAFPLEKYKTYFSINAHNEAINENPNELMKNNSHQTDVNKQLLENCRIVQYTSNYL